MTTMSSQTKTIAIFHTSELAHRQRFTRWEPQDGRGGGLAIPDMVRAQRFHHANLQLIMAHALMLMPPKKRVEQKRIQKL